MRHLESQIRKAILHPDEEVRVTATAYFDRTYSTDETVMPLVIQAVEKYGRQVAFRILRGADSVVQSPITVQWLIGELERDVDLEDVGQDNYRSAIALILYGSPPELLGPDIVELRNFPEELRKPFLERLEMAVWNWDDIWNALEVLGTEIGAVGGVWVRQVLRANRIVEALSRHRGHAQQVLALTNRRYGEMDRAMMYWLESPLIALAGRMGLQDAVPVLVERLHDDDWQISDAALTALGRIGGITVVLELASHWADGSDDFRHGAAEVMGHIPTVFSAEKCLELLATEEDEDTRNFLVNAALDIFVAEATEPARQMVLGDWDELTPDETDLRHNLLMAAVIMDVTFPEFDEWHEHVIRDGWGWGDIERPRIRENFHEVDRLDDEDWGIGEDCDDGQVDESWDDELDDDYDFDAEGPRLFDDLDEGRSREDTIRNTDRRVGRNDPCPCGSGKKYKKCCHRQPR